MAMEGEARAASAFHGFRLAKRWASRGAWPEAVSVSPASVHR